VARKLFVAGNWKMNLSRAEAGELASALAGKIGDVEAVDLAVCPPMVHLQTVGAALEGTNIALGAQNMFYEDNGAFTGETSAAMLTDAGCRYLILGHSERRHVMGEPDELINRKMLKALSAGLEPIFCVGELLEQREAGETLDVVRRQVEVGLEGVSSADAERITIAYEPVWAIGTGKTATPEQAQEVHAMIRELLGERLSGELAAAMRIQYGGSVKPNNAADLLGQPDIDGALVGGASLKADDFASIVQAGG
jgi:triosephosphate isomerase